MTRWFLKRCLAEHVGPRFQHLFESWNLTAHYDRGSTGHTDTLPYCCIPSRLLAPSGSWLKIGWKWRRKKKDKVGPNIEIFRGVTQKFGRYRYIELVLPCHASRPVSNWTYWYGTSSINIYWKSTLVVSTRGVLFLFLFQHTISHGNGWTWTPRSSELFPFE
jgi:hypothetical protein